MADKIVFTMGDPPKEGVEVTVPIKKTWYNRLRFWLFFKFFPFKFKEWGKVDEQAKI